MSKQHVYKVKLTEVAHTYVAADTMTEARSFTLSNVTVERLNMGEVIALTQRGIAIVDAETGKVCNASDPGADAGGNVASPEHVQV